MNKFITIDEQGWYCYFRTEHQGWLYKPSCWLLILFKKLKFVGVVNTYNIANGETIFSLDEKKLETTKNNQTKS